MKKMSRGIRAEITGQGDDLRAHSIDCLRSPPIKIVFGQGGDDTFAKISQSLFTKPVVVQDHGMHPLSQKHILHGERRE